MPKRSSPVSDESVLIDAWGRQGNRRLADRPCGACSKTFRPLRASSRYCSRECAWSKNGGHNKKDQSWWENAKGYIEGRVTLPDGTKKRVKQHRWIAEQSLGRPLLANEDIHHGPAGKTVNTSENMQVLAHGKHSTVTNYARIYHKGYKLNLSDEEREARSRRMKAVRAKALGERATTK